MQMIRRFSVCIKQRLTTDHAVIMVMTGLQDGYLSSRYSSENLRHQVKVYDDFIIKSLTIIIIAKNNNTIILVSNLQSANNEQLFYLCVLNC